MARLYVFGSALREDYRPGKSDVELLGTEVDPVMAGAVKNRYIARDIECSKEMLFAA